MNAWWLTYPVLGLFGGFVAGLFGVGGGLTLVPLLVMVFAWQGIPNDQVMHLALGTSMATIVLTSLSSLRAHHAHGAIRWDVVRSLAPGLLIGTFGGAQVAGSVPTLELSIAFVVIVYGAAIQMAMDFKPNASRQLPGPLGTFGVGTLIGIVSSFVAAGGGFLTVPFLLMCNVGIHMAVGTSSAIGFPIALAGALGYLHAGWGAQGLPEYAIGYVYWPAFVGIVVCSVLMAPVGARLAHRLPVRMLKRIFGGFLAVLATKMLTGLF